DSRSTFVKNADNTYTLTTKDQYKYYFNSSRYLYKMEDRNGNTVNLQVAADGKVQKITDAVGREFVVNYKPANGLIENITGPESVVISYGYDASNRLITVTDAEGSIMRYSYDTRGFISEIQDHYQKSIVKITYNHSEGENQHKVSQVIDSLGNTINYSYDITNKKTTVNDMNNRTSTYWFDSAMYTIREQDPEGKSTYTEYFQEGGKNKYGDIQSIIDRNGNKTEYAIDDRGNVTKIINPDQSFKEYSYDDKNNLTMEKDESEVFTFYVYDANKKLLIKKAQPLNGTDQYIADCDESKFAVTSYSYYTDSEAQSLFQSNAKGLLKSVKDPEENTTIYTYDADGNIRTVKDPEQKVTTSTYNRLGLNTSVLSPEGYNTSYVYDKNGLLEKISLHQGETTRIVYDMAGRKLQEIQPNQYNPAMDDLAGHKYNDSTVGYRYTYFDSGLLKSLTDPENNTTAYTYDVYGNKLTETRPDGSVMRYEYDIMDRLKKEYFKENSEAPEVILYEYSYALLEDGRTQDTQTRYLNDAEAAITVEIYDYAGRLTEKQYPDASKEKTVYNHNGTISSLTAKNGNITYFKYDEMNRPSEQWTPIEISEGSMLYRYTKIEYDKSGKTAIQKTGKDKVALFELPTGYASKSYTYYRNGKLKSIEDPEGRKTEYNYDDDGNLSQEDIYTDPDSILTTGYTYNHLGKPAERKVHIAAGDIYGNTFGSTADNVLLTTYTYDKNGNIETQTTPDMVTTTYTYDNMNRQLGISRPGVDEEGIETIITNSSTYDWEGKPLTKTDARGKTTGYDYSAMGYLIKVTDANNGVTAYEYDRAGRMTIEVSPKNYDSTKNLRDMNRVEYIYDLVDRVKEKKDIYANPQTGQWITLHTRSFKYDISGNVIKELDALGYEAGQGDTFDERLHTGYGIEYTYDLDGNLRTMLDPVSKQRGLAFTSSHGYDALGRKVSVTNAKGVMTLYSYDDGGNLLSVKVKKNINAYEQQTKGYTYDLAGRKLTETDGNGNTVEFEYNGLGRERRVTYPGDDTIDSNEIVFQYDVNGNLAYKKDTMGRTELYTYDNRNRVLSFTERKQDGSEAITAAYKYDKNGNKRYEFDGNGTRRENIYDDLNRLEETKITVNGISKSTTYDYDANGNQTSVTDWLGNTYTNTYDPLNRLVERKDPYTTIQRLEYTRNSLQSRSYDALDNLTQYFYDRNGRLITTIDAENHITNQTYDDVGNIQSKSDGRGITTVYGYDEFNRLLSVTNAKGETTSYTYDLNGNMLTQTDAKENTTIYEYNVANKLVRRMDHGGKLGASGSNTYILAKTEAYTYYPEGSIKTKKDRNGKTTAYTYDIHGRLTSKEIGPEEISYTYDNNGNQLTMTDSTGSTERTYDEENRVLTKTVPGIGTISYQYDILEAAGCYSEISEDPKNNVTEKVFDKTGRLIEVIEENNPTSFEYYANGSKKSVTYPDGSREAYTYYNDNLLKTLVNTKGDGTVLDTYSYTYDAAHNQTTKTDSKGTTRYEYDGLNRLSKVTEPSGKTTSYIFDKAGNRIQETVIENNISTTTVYSYNEQNRLTDTITRSGFVTEKVKYEYDNNGNTLVKVKETTKPVDPDTAGSFAFQKAGTSTTREVSFMDYDVWNRMVKTIEGDKTILYKYNGEGYRVEKAVNDQITKYMYEADKVILEVDGQGNETARNTYGSNILSRTVDNETAYYMYNGHGDVTALLSDTGNVLATYYYDAFGNPLETIGEISNPFRYAGYQYDEETGVYYLNARYYDPKIARFLTEDTYRGSAADPLSLNLYTYCANEPIKYTDPTGHFINPIVGIGIGIAIGVISDIISGTTGNSGSGNNDDDDRGSGGNSNNNSGINQTNKPENENWNNKGGFGLANMVNQILAQIESLKSPFSMKATNDMTNVPVSDVVIPQTYNNINKYTGALYQKWAMLDGETGNIIGDGSTIISVPAPIGVSMEEIEGKANAYVEDMLMKMFVENDANYYKHSTLAALITKLITKSNQHKLFDAGTGLKKYLSSKSLSQFVKDGVSDFFYSPSETVKYEMNKGIVITMEQINNLDDYKYLIQDKNVRVSFTKSLQEKFDKYSKADIDEYSEKVNNDIYKSKILTRISEVKMLNDNYKKSLQNYEGLLDRVEEKCKAEFSMYESEQLNKFWKRVNGYDIYKQY
ncbi:MAG: hypothetical protein APF77_03395, partial [Clostridia bacterium BRH_c25]